MTATEYRVSLDAYCGPLDLLLYLVRRNEVDVVALPIASIATQFLEFVETMQFLDLDVAADFVATASALAEIKSRLVLPQPEEETVENVEDTMPPQSELVQRLLEYKKYKDAAKALEERAAEWQERYPRLSDNRPAGGKDPSVDRIKEVELWDLVSALTRILRKNSVAEEGRIRYDETPISVYIEQIGARVREEGRVAFSAFFKGEKVRSRIVGLFLAILELLRHHSFRAEQPVEYGEIWVLPPVSEVTDE